MNKAKLERREKNKKDKAWAIAVKEAYGNCCAVCGDNKRLNAHHIISRTIKEFRHEVVNGIALCPKHHRFSFKFSAHQNPFIFYRWFAKAYGYKYERLEALIFGKEELWRSEIW